MVELAKVNKEEFVKIINYYNGMKYTIKLELFLQLPFEMQLGFLLQYFEKVHNISMIVDLNTIIVHYVNCELDANKIVDNYNKTGVWTDRIVMLESQQKKSIIDSYYAGVEIILSKILIPF